jgi:NAD-dependent dihydropyrimidine dehydrogenase PreA subunit
MICLLIPFFTVLGGFTTSKIHETLAGVNRKVTLAKILAEPAVPAGQPESIEVSTFKSSGKPVAQVYSEASVTLKQFFTGSWILGCFLGLVFGITLAYRMVTVYRTDYTPNKGTCFSCARCVDYCPVDRNPEKQPRYDS